MGIYETHKPLVDIPWGTSVDEVDQPRIIDVDRFLAIDIPAREMIVAPWLQTQGLAMLHSKRGVGKTHVLLGLAYAVACGTSFLRWKVPKARGVLYLDGEMPASAMQERLAGLKRVFGPTKACFRIFTPDLQRRSLNLAEPGSRDSLSTFLDGIELIVVDNLSCLARGGQENEAESWIPIQEWLLQMRANGRAVLVAHHSGKAGLQRGTSKREDVLDTVLALRHPDDYEASQGARFEVYYEKSRGFYGEDADPFEARLVEGNEGPKWAFQALQGSTFSKVLVLAKQGKGCNEIARELDVDPSVASRHMARARAEGRLPEKAQRTARKGVRAASVA